MFKNKKKQKQWPKQKNDFNIFWKTQPDLRPECNRVCGVTW